ncbi:MULTISPECIES: AbrB/MazE/SpoVT family DNA-binding domain-containing protein [Acidianus]|uniref:AbrB family transcriptional regulator n=1 Tax=Candidatus Acidianus copahuensis TaxID=1160895 RepID=A0A031LQ75_9CREN|nr:MULTISPECIES: AbrB/MazE/SpoVT family DNA-binding domain-containing protein [Acidianus]EZQ06870.1 AbrB family transcriptional regulator [Candidatus Acidianus copahuensis]NON61349.1 phosphate uptake regulator PhoU [Acidianus sp. RZ1]
MEDVDNSKDIETRKVQKLGSSSLFIVLPKKWINRWSIKPGDKILIEVSDDGSLKLLAEKTRLLSNRKSIQIDVDLFKQPIPGIIPCLYSLGYDEIVFISKKSIIQKDIEDIITVTKQMVGAEVTEASENKIKVECLLDAEKVGVESLLRRMLNIISKKIDDIVSYASSEERKNNGISTEDLRKVYLMLLRHTMGSRYNMTKNMSRNFLVVENATLLLNVSKIIDEIFTLVTSSKLSEVELSMVSSVMQRINDLLDEVVMTILFPSIKRVSNGLGLISQIKNTISSISSLQNSALLVYIQVLISNLEMALDNSSCTLFLEDMPWIERNFNSIK